MVVVIAVVVMVVTKTMVLVMQDTMKVTEVMMDLIMMVDCVSCSISGHGDSGCSDAREDNFGRGKMVDVRVVEVILDT